MVPGLPYRRSQQVPLFVTFGFIGIMLLVVVGGALMVFREGGGVGLLLFLLPVLLAMVILAYTLIAFRRLTVEVSGGEVRLAFGNIGPRKRIDLTRVSAVRPVRNRWIYGWGIRWLPHGWMWNIWGLSAVELDLEGKKRFRIGTDRPGELATVIEMARQASVERPGRQSTRS